MTLLSSFICRLGGHKPYEMPRMVWDERRFGNPHDGTIMMVRHCKRCGVVLAKRPASNADEQIEA